MPKKDLNQLAFDVVRRATGEAEVIPESNKATSGRKGGLKGGAARATSLTPKQRSEIAKKAAAARWNAKTKAAAK
jgi:hypothetical protein